jgi:GNAT superfamily N-acetyltransferase
LENTVAEISCNAWDVCPLDKSHDKTSFDCGRPTLNRWLQQLASQYERRDLARTYVAVRPNETRVLGFYAISNHQVNYQALPDEQARGLPDIDIPAILLGRLAVDKTVQGQGLGEHLLLDALRRANHVSQYIGVRAVEVHAIDDEARQFYSKYGFVSLHDDRQHLFLSMNVVRQLKLPPL